MSEGETKAGSPRLLARIAGVFYALTFLTGGIALFVRSPAGMAAGFIAGACYIAVTFLLYFLFKPVSKGVSLLAAIISLLGCAIGPLSMLYLVPFKINPLVFFGFYCLLIAYLIYKSTFLPHVLGGLMAFAAFGWLTFLSPDLGEQLSPYNFIPGILGEGALTAWLLVVGVDVQRWKEQASAGGKST